MEQRTHRRPKTRGGGGPHPRPREGRVLSKGSTWGRVGGTGGGRGYLFDYDTT